jgi:hypothetical protein
MKDIIGAARVVHNRDAPMTHGPQRLDGEQLAKRNAPPFE